MAGKISLPKPQNNKIRYFIYHKGFNYICDKGIKILSTVPWRLEFLSIMMNNFGQGGIYELTTANFPLKTFHPWYFYQTEGN